MNYEIYYGASEVVFLNVYQIVDYARNLQNLLNFIPYNRELIENSTGFNQFSHKKIINTTYELEHHLREELESIEEILSKIHINKD